MGNKKYALPDTDFISKMHLIRKDDQNEIDFTREDAEPYIRSYMNECLGKNQTTFKVQDTSKEKRIRKVPCEQVFDEMFTGKIEETKAGNLKYIHI